MGKTFFDVDGYKHQVDDYDEFEFDEDIVSGDISGYYAVNPVGTRVEITKTVYEALIKH